MTAVACSSSPPQDEFNEINVEEGEIPVASTDELPTDPMPTDPLTSEPVTTAEPTQLESDPYGLNAQVTEPVEKPIKKRNSSKRRRVLSQDTTPPEPTVAEQPVAEEPITQPTESAPVETPPPAPIAEAPPAYVPPPVSPVQDEVQIPIYQHKFFIPGVIAALIALFFLFRKKR